MYQNFVFCIPDYDNLVGRNMKKFIVYINEFKYTCLYVLFCAILGTPIILLVLKWKRKTEKTWWRGDKLRKVGRHASLWKMYVACVFFF